MQKRVPLHNATPSLHVSISVREFGSSLSRSTRHIQFKTPTVKLFHCPRWNASSALHWPYKNRDHVGCRVTLLPSYAETKIEEAPETCRYLPNTRGLRSSHYPYLLDDAIALHYYKRRSSRVSFRSSYCLKNPILSEVSVFRNLWRCSLAVDRHNAHNAVTDSAFQDPKHRNLESAVCMHF